MRLDTLLAVEQLGLRLLVGADKLDRSFHRVFTATLRDPRRYLSGGELVLSGMEWWHTPADSDAFVAALAEAEVAALGAGTAEWGGGPVPEHVLQACRKHGVPLIEVPVTVSFATVSERVILWLAAERAENTPYSGAFLDSYRRLVAVLGEGGGLEALTEAGAAELGAACAVFGSSGRRIAGTGPDSADGTWLAGEFLRAERLPARVDTESGPVTLFDAAARSGRRLTSWFLAITGDHEQWSGEHRGLATELATLIGLEHARLDERRRLADTEAGPLFTAILERDSPAEEVTARLHQAGLAATEPVCVLLARLRGAVPGLAIAALAELLAPHGDRVRIGEHGDEVLGLAPVPAADLDAAGAVFEAVKQATRILEPALGSARLAIGATFAPEAARVGAAVQEVTQLRELAELSPGRVNVIAGADLASHRLLFAAIPDQLRRTFRARVLGPLLDYDAEHNSGLVHTLRAFLRNSGSWTQTSAELHVHVNTLRYRIGRIAELTGRDLAVFSDRIDLYLALDSWERE